MSIHIKKIELHEPNDTVPTARDTKGLNLHLFKEVAVSCDIRIGQLRTTIGDLLALKPGDLRALNTAPEESVELLLNDKCIAKGSLVVTDQHYGVLIHEVLS